MPLQGTTKFLANLAALRVESKRSVHTAIAEAQDSVYDASQNLVPIDTGALKASGTKEPIQESGPVISASISYGRTPSLIYAVIQHEVTTFNHPQGGTHHYLEQPLLALADALPGRIGAEMQKGFVRARGSG